MRISIVVPALNEAEQIEATLLPLQPLRARGHELILSDGCSADGTLARAKPWVDRLVQSPRGRAMQMNQGAQAATGDLLLFLHADTQLPENTEALLREFWQSDKFWGRFDVRLSGKHPAFRLIAWLMNWRSRLTGIATGDQAIFVRRMAFEQIGGFPALPLMEDIAISRLLKRQSRPFCIRTPLVTSSRRWETHGILRTILLMWWLRLQFFCGVAPERLARLYR